MSKADTYAQQTLAALLAQIQSEIEPPPLDSVNPHFRSRYTSLAAAREAIIPVCTRHGVSVTQDVQTSIQADGLYASVTTILTSSTGERLVYGPLSVPAQSRTAQHLAGATTYGRRISLLSTFALAGEDDLDGEEQRTNGHHKTEPAPAPKPAPRPAPAPAPAPRPTPKPAPLPDGPVIVRLDTVPAPHEPRERERRDDEYEISAVEITKVYDNQTKSGKATWKAAWTNTQNERGSASTFSRTVADTAKRAVVSGELVNVIVAPSSNPAYLDLLAVEPFIDQAPTEPEDEPELGEREDDGIPF